MPLAITRRALFAATAALALAGQGQAQGDIPVIAAASDLQFALTEIAAAFRADTGMDVRLAFGSTGNFARQIREGAPFQIFMAADESFIAALHADGFTPDAGDLYALGRIVIMVPTGSALTPDPALDSLARMLAAGQITRFAIPNPDHAPYGMRAREALITKGIWDDLHPVLVVGENVSQAAQFALSGNAEGGIIAYSLALAPEVTARGNFALIPEDWHEPLRQRMVLLNGAGQVAQAFYAYMNARAARDIMDRYGFTLPQE
ncbi:MAG: molybdate ABC transporter substrate-binding protein [Pseudotabrizicola sp.]|nr:molybdate ABC transporter substrate-binding protein [Pseudotabrizicola sp.]MDO8882659.1 molybdate ABC transporter substrate-binding protein [Pseudotabrizicola sp.]MDP2081418.1 molybdate ABC transporter substrate-binding protein [Pseudotabrizicola sp.]MDZ7572931.1 molybdate ABC transporter substrate-binding protein [Pseudotabrizicola sp.]